MRLLIAEDVDLVAEAFQALLETEPGFEVVGRIGRGDEVVEAVNRLRPDIALLDVDMPGMTGIDATRALLEQRPDCKVILLTALPGSGHLHKALSAGANGYLMKSTSARRLIEGIYSVSQGGTVVDPQLAADALRRGPSPLTERETDVLRLVQQGLTTDDISNALFLSLGTVRNYLSNAMTKLGANNRTAAVAEADKQGWL